MIAFATPDMAAQVSPARDEIHVWRIDVPRHALRAEGADVLSAEERARARRFVFPEDRIRYAVSHSALRNILSRYLNVGPTTLRLTPDRYGKPQVHHKSDLEFNISHSGDLALVAIAWDRRVGVDVEQHRILDYSDLARACFSPSELELFARVPPEDREACFYRTWTRKEA